MIQTLGLLDLWQVRDAVGEVVLAVTHARKSHKRILALIGALGGEAGDAVVESAVKPAVLAVENLRQAEESLRKLLPPQRRQMKNGEEKWEHKQHS